MPENCQINPCYLYRFHPVSGARCEAVPLNKPVNLSRQKFFMPTNKDRARWATKQAWRTNKIPHPKTLLCSDCGGPAVEYDHYLGYEREHWLDVQPVCRRCHHQRGYKRGERHAVILHQESNMFRERYYKLRAFAEANPTLFKEFCNKTAATPV
jgi:hypothetical protein